jgi:RimJ/RimL family protein N-acetyltransferase
LPKHANPARAAAGRLVIIGVMPDIASFSVAERLGNGAEIEIRALRPGDRQALRLAAERTSDRSLYRRFFGVRREFSDEEVASFVDVDFVNQVALVAISSAAGNELIVAGGRYIIVRPGTAEIAFTVVDEFQGQGIASALLRHLVTLARRAGLRQFIAEVLPDNAAMLRVLERSGLRSEKKREHGVVHITLQLD